VYEGCCDHITAVLVQLRMPHLCLNAAVGIRTVTLECSICDVYLYLWKQPGTCDERALAQS
jgi:hypothetical protein